MVRLNFGLRYPTTVELGLLVGCLVLITRTNFRGHTAEKLMFLNALDTKLTTPHSAGLNHATCHTRKYYFKQGNQIGSDTTLTHMTDSFHTYAVEWHPDVIYGLVDGKRYYTYDKNADDLEWPFQQTTRHYSQPCHWWRMGRRKRP